MRSWARDPWGPDTVPISLLACHPGCTRVACGGDFVTGHVSTFTSIIAGAHGQSYKARYSIDVLGNSAASPDLEFDSGFIVV
jgi:hypothetical protein